MHNDDYTQGWVAIGHPTKGHVWKPSAADRALLAIAAKLLNEKGRVTT